MGQKAKTLLFDHRAVAEMVSQVTTAILADFPKKRLKNVALLGIQHNGYPLSQRLAHQIKEATGIQPPIGTLDISMYRDDVGLRKNLTTIHPTDISFDLDDLIIILVDDVLQTGRTIRAALDAITDYGRPELIRLAVLIDRGNREFPIRADYAGSLHEVPGNQKIKIVWKNKSSKEDAVYLCTN